MYYFYFDDDGLMEDWIWSEEELCFSWLPAEFAEEWKAQRLYMAEDLPYSVEIGSLIPMLFLVDNAKIKLGLYYDSERHDYCHVEYHNLDTYVRASFPSFDLAYQALPKGVAV